MLRATSFGAHVKIVASLIDVPLNAFIFRAGEGIKQPQDLNGKSFGYCSSDSSTVFLDASLKTNAIIPSHKRNVSFDLVSTLGTKRVDVIYGAYWNIETEQLRSLGIDTEYYTFKDLGLPNYHELLIIAKDRTPCSEAPFAALFRDALNESIVYCREHPDEAFAIYNQANPDKSAVTQAWERLAWMKTLPVLTHNQHFDAQEIQYLYDWFVKQQILNAPFDPQALWIATPK